MSVALLDGSGPMRWPQWLRRWCCCGIVRMCLFGAGFLLTTARTLYRLGLVEPARVGQMLTWSSYLSQVGLRAWRASLIR
jgi:hypothetical protein